VARRVSDREVHALILGDGPALDDVKRVAARESAPARIHFPALQRDTSGYLAASDVVVFPFDHPESLPMFLLESSAAGRPIVCADGPRNRELIIDGETGRAVRGGIGDFAAAVVELLEHPETGAVYSHAAQQRALVSFDSHPMAREITDIYRSVLAARAA
jgi:glycosyltransferase involved in cell wall biosynthesis